MAAEQTIDPIHQFRIEPIIPMHIGKIDISFTNSSLFMMIVLALACVVMLAGTAGDRIVPGKLQSAAEMGYEFVGNMI